MEYFAGLDVSNDETSLCVVDEKGAVILTAKALTEPDAIEEVLRPYAGRLRRVGHEAGSLSPWLHAGLEQLGVPIICLETRHVRAAMSAQRNKTDAADALGLAHIMRTGWFKTAHMKNEVHYRLRLLLTHRRNMKRKFLDLENAVRHSLKVFGVKLGKVGRGGFEAAARRAVAADPLTANVIDCMLTARAALWEQYLRLHKLVVGAAINDELCTRFMAIPGVGPVTALNMACAIDDPSRFKRSRDVGAYFGLTSRRWQSGTSIDIKGRISKIGDADVRRSLYEAATVLLKRFKGQDSIKSWGLKIAKRSCHAKACVAVARKLATIMHAMWRDGTFYDGNNGLSKEDDAKWMKDKLARIREART
jgi:transposase